MKKPDPIIRTIRGLKVILDLDLAAVYVTSTKRLNEQVRRSRLLAEIATTSQPAKYEIDAHDRSQNATGSQKHRSRAALPYAFTEHGALMAAQSDILKAPGGLAPPEPKFHSLPRSFRTFAPSTSAFARLPPSRLALWRTSRRDKQGRGGRLTLRRKLQPPPDPPKKEIGFHVRERSARYSIKRTQTRRTLS
ncbi:MAG TPA: ORF6N domain-containing protein [Kiritimatiellia bacterium]|nr:ORF6N domain-containing protein [Kiritimatiellia bacterium]